MPAMFYNKPPGVGVNNSGCGTLDGMTKFAAIAILLFACSKEDYKNQKPPEPEKVTVPEKKAAPKPKAELKPEELGSCELEATGAVKAKQTSYGGRPATNVSYWLSPDEQGTMSAIKGFNVNCHGPDMKFSIMPGGGKPDGQPFQPKKYDIKKGTGDASVMVSFPPKEGKAAKESDQRTLGDAAGTVDITAFDKKHIAGTINIKGKLVPGGGAVTVTGKFDFKCPGFKGCEE